MFYNRLNNGKPEIVKCGYWMKLQYFKSNTAISLINGNLLPKIGPMFAQIRDTLHNISTEPETARCCTLISANPRPSVAV